MHRGTGKSIFTEKMNTLYKKPISIENDLDVRTYHLNRLQSAGEGDFIRWIQYLWTHDYSNEEYMGIRNINELISENNSPAEAFAAYLSDVLESRRERGDKYRIMMVFDGLDEIDNDNIVKFFPTEEMLSEGVYVLFTSRNPNNEDMPNNTAELIHELKATEVALFDVNSSENIKFLKQYISRFGIRDEVTKDRMIKAASYRILDLVLLCALYKKDCKMEVLERADSFVKMYISYIEEHYTEREFSKLKEILVILAVLGDKEILTLKKIGQISSENEITLRLVGMMADLAPLLNVSRDKEGNRYRIVNEDIAKELITQLPDKDDILRRLVELAMANINEFTTIDKYSGEEALCAHVTDLALLLPEKSDALGEDRILSLHVFWMSNKSKAEDLYDKERALKNQKQYVNLVEVDVDDVSFVLKSELEYAEALCEMGDCLQALDLYEKVLDKSMSIIEDKEIKFQCKMGMGHVYEYMYRYLDAFYMFCDAYEIGLSNENRDETDLLLCRMNIERIVDTVYLSIDSNLYDEDEKEKILGYISERVDKIFEEHDEIKDKINNWSFGGFKDEYKKIFDGLADVIDNGEVSQDILKLLGILFEEESQFDGIHDSINKLYEKCVLENGKNHPITLQLLVILIMSLAFHGRYDEALCKAKELYEGRALVFGETNELTISAKEVYEMLKRKMEET